MVAWSPAGMRGSLPRMEVIVTMQTTGFSCWYSCFVPLTPASFHQAGTRLCIGEARIDMHTHCTLCAQTMHILCRSNRGSHLSLSVESGVPIDLPRVVKPLFLFEPASNPPCKEWVIWWGVWALLQILHCQWSVSAKLPLVFRLLDPLKRREATSTDPSLRCHVGPAKKIKTQKEKLPLLTTVKCYSCIMMTVWIISAEFLQRSA